MKEEKTRKMVKKAEEMNSNDIEDPPHETVGTGNEPKKRQQDQER